MKKEDDRVFKEAIAYERTKKWHLAFADKEPKTGRKFKCKTYLVPYKILAETVIKKNELVQTIEPGLYLISNPFSSFHLCINPKIYRRTHTSVGFIDKVPEAETTSYISVISVNGKPTSEVPHVTDKILVVKILDKDLYYVTTIAGTAYYLFVRKTK